MPPLSMPSAPLEPPTPWHGSAALVEWITAAGGWVHPALCVGSARGGGERGVFVTAAVPRGPLAFVPLSCCVTAADADAGPASRLWAPGGVDAGDGDAAALRTPEARLAAHLLLRASSYTTAEDAAADVYVSSLPGRAPSALAGFPLTWRAPQVGALRHAALEAALLAARAEAEAQHGALSGAAPFAERGLYPSLRDWLWARALVASRAYAPPAQAGGGLALEPLLDCVNHAPFPTSAADDADPRTRCRNALHSYVPAGTTAASAAAAGLGGGALPAACAARGAAALLALRPLRPGEEVFVSYRDATPGGGLTAQESLSRYGFLPDGGAAAAANHVIDENDAAAARASLATFVDAAVAAGAPPAALLQAALAAHARDVAAAAAADHAEALASEAESIGTSGVLVSQFGDSDAPAARLAALYRLGRRLALGRAALARLPRAEVAGSEGLAAGVAAGVRAAAESGVFDACAPGAADAFGAVVLQTLAGEEAPRLTPAQALALR
jgi:hypothetical protein